MQAHTHIHTHTYTHTSLYKVCLCCAQVPEPGESLLRVLRVEAMWGETPSDGRERMLARCRRFYRPEVRLTTLGSHVAWLKKCRL